MKSSVYSSVSEAVMAARGAFGRYSELTLNERNEILEAVRTAVRPKIAELAEMTVTTLDGYPMSKKGQSYKALFS